MSSSSEYKTRSYLNAYAAIFAGSVICARLAAALVQSAMLCAHKHTLTPFEILIHANVRSMVRGLYRDYYIYRV